MANIFSLYGSIFVDNEKANKSIDDTTKKAKDAGDKSSKSFGEIVKSGAKMATAIVGATTAVIGGVMAMANSTAQTADTIDKASIRMGVSAEDYQRLAYAAGQCGVEMSVMEKAGKKLEGMDINMDEAMASIMSMATAEERAQKASELFGDSIAYQLSPLIEQSTEDYDGLIARADELGIVMSNDAVNAGVVFGDTLSDLKQMFSGLTNELMSACIPIITELMNIIIDNLPMFQTIVDALLPVMISLIESLAPVIQPLMELVADLISNVLVPILPILSSIANVIVSVLISALKAITPVVSGVLEIFTRVFGALYNIVKKPINAVIDIINNGLIKNLNKIKIPSWVPVFGGKGFSMPYLQKLKVGMDYVPYDEMPALLHKGEAVLTKEEAQAYRRGENGTTNTTNNNYSNVINIQKLEVREENDIERIAEELYYLQMKRAI